MYVHLKKITLITHNTCIFSRFHGSNNNLYNIAQDHNAANSYNEMRLQGRKKSSTMITAAETLTTRREVIHLYYVVIIRSIYNACNYI